MTEIVVIPTDDDNGLNARISSHFGRAPFFTIVYMDSSGNIIDVKTISNTSGHLVGTGTTADKILSLKPTCVIVRGMGWRALEKFKAEGIRVYKTDALSVQDALELFKSGKLEKMIEACPGKHNL